MKTVAAVLPALLLATACADSPARSGRTGPAASGPCGLDFLNGPAEVVTEPELAEVPEDEANLVLDLSSSASEAVRVTIQLDGRVALDVRTPAVPKECAHSPVCSHAFRVPGTEVVVAATTDQGKTDSATVPLGGATHWVAVQPQDGFPLEVRVFDEEMSWG